MTAADTTDFLSIHRCLRLGGRSLARAVDQIDPADRDRVAALARYWAGYTNEVLHHHGVEDDIFYPALVERAPVAAEHLGRIEADHHTLDELMDEGEAAMADLVAGHRNHRAAAVLARLDDVMWTHLAYEDNDLVPLFPQHFDHDEYEALAKAAVKSLGLKQALFTVPFVGSWVSEEVREQMLGDAPLPFRVLYRLTKNGHERLAARALGDVRRAVAEDLPVAAV